jgi:hypothetical protein
MDFLCFEMQRASFIKALGTLSLFLCITSTCNEFYRLQRTAVEPSIYNNSSMKGIKGCGIKIWKSI